MKLKNTNINKLTPELTILARQKNGKHVGCSVQVVNRCSHYYKHSVAEVEIFWDISQNKISQIVNALDDNLLTIEELEKMSRRDEIGGQFGETSELEI